MESPEEIRAKELISKAEKALKSGWGWFSSSTKYEDAFTLYSKAANNYKIAKNWENAGRCFVLCADMKSQSQSQFDAASQYILAAEMYQRVDPSIAVGHYSKAISLFTEIGKFGLAAKNAEKVGEMYEKDNNISDASRFFQQAADYYSGDNSSARANKCLEKVAYHVATLEDYSRGFDLFQKLGTESLDNNLLKFNAKNHFLHACFCVLAKNDMVAAQNAIDRFLEIDYSFADTRESKLVQELIDGCSDLDVDKFADALYSFDTVKKLTPWETSILLRVKNTLTEHAQGTSDLC